MFLFLLSVELLGLFDLFLTLFLSPSEFWSPSEIGGYGENSLPPSVFNMGVAVCSGMMPGVLFRVTLDWTLEVVLRFAFVVCRTCFCSLIGRCL